MEEKNAPPLCCYEDYMNSLKCSEQGPVGEIIRSSEGRVAPVSCLKTEKIDCPQADECITLPMWRELDRRIDRFLDSVTLADLIHGTIPVEP